MTHCVYISINDCFLAYSNLNFDLLCPLLSLLCIIYLYLLLIIQVNISVFPLCLRILMDSYSKNFYCTIPLQHIDLYFYIHAGIKSEPIMLLIMLMEAYN